METDDLFARDEDGNVLIDPSGYPVLREDIGDDGKCFAPTLRDEVIRCIEESAQCISFDQMVIASFEDTDEDSPTPYRRGYRTHGVPLFFD